MLTEHLTEMYFYQVLFGCRVPYPRGFLYRQVYTIWSNMIIV